ncbi:glycoside hydrolase family 25 protein [Hespellia stercorisuis]|nr:glycoside hydrolase family 25 protein [Hespellia stercorisuis]
MKKKAWTILIVCSMLALTACGDAEKKSGDTEVVETLNLDDDDSEEKEDAQQAAAAGNSVMKYQFKDVRGNDYEGTLVDSFPKCTYDFTKLVEENGYKYYRDEENGITSRLGIDVSQYQADLDWTQARASGIEFAILRVGGRGYGASGTIYEDEKFRDNLRGAVDAGLEVGVYFFSQAISEREAVEEAEFVLSKIEAADIKGPVVFDPEEIKEDESRTDGISSKVLTDNCIAFCDTIKAAGYDTMIYANMKRMALELDIAKLQDYDWWYADYYETPQCPYDYEMWQYTDTGSVPGVEGNVDIDIWFQHEKGE